MIPSFQQYQAGQKFETNNETNKKEEPMSLPDYDLDKVEDKGGSKFEAGEYFFEIKDAKEKTAKTGTVYTALTLDVETSTGQCKVFDNVFYSEKALFKLKQLVDATGMSQPKETEDFIGATGKAKFILGERGYLEVKWYISRAEATLNSSEVVKKVADAFPPVDPIDAPF